MSKIINDIHRLITTLADNNRYPSLTLTCDEKISAYCSFVISVTSKNIIENKNLGQPVTVAYSTNKETRHFWGICKKIKFIDINALEKTYHYQIEAADPLSLLALRKNRQIFQNMSTKQILETVFEKAKMTEHIAFSVSGSGKSHTYCVQLDETDQAFIQRLLANEGWHFHVNHSENSPGIVIGDSNQRFEDLNEGTLNYIYGDKDAPFHRILRNWQNSINIGPGNLSLKDHNQILGEKLESDETNSAFSPPLTQLSQYLYGLGFEDKDETREAAKRYMEALDAQKQTSHSSSDILALSCGLKFILAKHPFEQLNQEYLVTHIEHQITMTLFSGQYQNDFTCIPTTSIYRPLFLTKPKVYSVHSATVTGPDSEEIYRDEQGRIKVQFHWDNEGEGNENTSCWLPVSQSFASKGFGAQFTPRIGDEVLVQYIDGNPDKPVVVGSIYNDKNTAPYPDASQSGIKTRTTPEGSSLQGNELRFEDKKDEEQFFLHAQKDLMTDVNNDSTEIIKGRKISQIEKDVELTAKENIAFSTEKEFNTNSKENWLSESAQNITLKAGAEMALEATSAITVDGEKISITGKSAITLTVGSSTIEITPSGINIKAPQIVIEGSAKAELKAAAINIEAQAGVDIKGTLATVEGSAMTEIKSGAMAQIKAGIIKVN